MNPRCPTCRGPSRLKGATDDVLIWQCYRCGEEWEDKRRDEDTAVVLAEGWLYGIEYADGSSREILRATFSRTPPAWAGEKPVRVLIQGERDE